MCMKRKAMYTREQQHVSAARKRTRVLHVNKCRVILILVEATTNKIEKENKLETDQDQNE